MIVIQHKSSVNLKHVIFTMYLYTPFKVKHSKIYLICKQVYMTNSFNFLIYMVKPFLCNMENQERMS